MNGFLGTTASFWSDLSLVLILLFGGMAVYGGIRARQKRFSAHCPMMAVAALLNWVPVLVVMVPGWIGVVSDPGMLESGPLAMTAVFHGLLGGFTQVLMTYTVVRMYWFKQIPPKKPIWLMRSTLGLWMLTIIGGVVVYTANYVA